MVAVRKDQRPYLGKVQEQQGERPEPVEMRQQRHGYFPHVFVWRGKEYQVEAVERCLTVSHLARGNLVEGHHFRVRCQDGTFDLFQDTRNGTWHMQRRRGGGHCLGG